MKRSKVQGPTSASEAIPVISQLAKTKVQVAQILRATVRFRRFGITSFACESGLWTLDFGPWTRDSYSGSQKFCRISLRRDVIEVQTQHAPRVRICFSGALLRATTGEQYES